VRFCVPTGNFGDILAGYYCKKYFKFPLKLVIGSNSNDILPRFFETGSYSIQGAVVPTLSPSMDIQVSSNFERFVYDVVGNDAQKVAELLQNLKNLKSFEVSSAELEFSRENFSAYGINEDDTVCDLF